MMMLPNGAGTRQRGVRDRVQVCQLAEETVSREAGGAVERHLSVGRGGVDEFCLHDVAAPVPPALARPSYSRHGEGGPEARVFVRCRATW